MTTLNSIQIIESFNWLVLLNYTIQGVVLFRLYGSATWLIISYTVRQTKNFYKQILVIFPLLSNADIRWLDSALFFLDF